MAWSTTSILSLKIKGGHHSFCHLHVCLEDYVEGVAKYCEACQENHKDYAAPGLDHVPFHADCQSYVLKEAKTNQENHLHLPLTAWEWQRIKFIKVEEEGQDYQHPVEVKVKVKDGLKEIRELVKLPLGQYNLLARLDCFPINEVGELL